MKSKFDLKSISPSEHILCKKQDVAIKWTSRLQEDLYDALYLMFAHDKYSLLIILQGIDTAGKDSTVRHIYSAANPQGINVFSFKKPTPVELRHDFLWRCHMHTPESGLTTIFNRSYYEEITTLKVHPEKLQNEHIPNLKYSNQEIFDHRCDRINDFEKLLCQKGTIVIKFFLHISKSEQKKRIEERFTNRSKNWKFSIEDAKERKHWDEYQKSFEYMLNNTNTKIAPWTVVPADQKWYRNFVISKTIVDRLLKYKMTFPKTILKKPLHLS